jgi:L-ascorbate metabolism protein UlaG (beta-lactamase superfamily)
MDIYYLHNSGFAIEIGGNLFIIDYCQGSFGKPWTMPAPNSPAQYAGVAVLASHSHGDHFTPEILSWRRERPDIEYVLSEDIRPAAEKAIAKAGAADVAGDAAGAAGAAGTTGVSGAAIGAAGGTAGCAVGATGNSTGSTVGAVDAAGGTAGAASTVGAAGATGRSTGGTAGAAPRIAYLSPGDATTAAGAAIKAYGSTDLGVSFHIEAEGGASIFHAGDLNFWHWADESTAAEVGEAKAAFLRELALIKAGVRRIDVAFFPADPRLRTDYWRGAAMFCEAMRPTYFIPMHFSGAFAHPQEFYGELAYCTSAIKIDREMQRLRISV